MKKNFSEILRKTKDTLIRRPVLLLFGGIVWLLLLGFQFVVRELTGSVPTIRASSVYLTLLAFFLFLVLLFLISSLLSIFAHIVKRKRREIGKTIIPTFFVLVLTIIAGAVVWAVSHFGILYVGKLFSLSLETALVLFFIVYVGGILGFIIFFTYAPLLAAASRLPTRNAIRNSFRITRQQYAATLLFHLSMFILFQIASLLPMTMSEIVMYLLLPIALVYLVHFLEE